MGIVSTASTILGTEGAGAGGGTGGTGAGGVTTQQLADAIAAREIAQLARDQAQDQFAEAEELDDDTKNLAQDNLIQANEDLINANALVESNREIARNAEQLLQNDRLSSLEGALGTPAEVFDIADVVANSNVQIFNWNGNGNNDIELGGFKVTTDPASIEPLESITIPNGETVRAYVIGVLEGGGNTGGVLSLIHI